MKHIFCKLFLLLSFISICNEMLAQGFTLVGKVIDEENNPIEFASVTISKQGRMTMTNIKGEYSLQGISSDTVIVKFSMVGYRSKTRVLHKPSGKQTLQVTLYSDNNLGEVVVTETRRQTNSTQKIDVKDMKVAPSASGNAVEDLIKSQAGVSSHSELSSQYNVRGGAFDENSVYINNVEVMRPFLVRSGQQEGLSIINADMVESIGFSTGGFDAKYGDKMSSALDIHYKRLKHNEASFQASLLGASAYVGLAGKKWSWINGVRYKTNRYLLGSLETKGEYNPNFLDYQTFFSYSPSNRWTIDFIGNISDNHYNFTPEDRETKFGTMENVKSFKVYFDGKEKDLFRTFFGTIGVHRNISANTHLSFLGTAFHTKEQETYDIQGQYWLDQTETSEQLGIGTYMEHARNYLNATVLSGKLMLQHHSHHHDTETGVTYKIERIKENSKEYEMRDSAGYSVPHTGKDLFMIYSLNARNELKANRVEAYLQDSYRFSSKDEKTFFTLNYGLRLSHWNYNKETLVSPRASISIVPAFNHDITLRFATGLYYQSPFFKELRDTTTINGITYATLNKDIKSQRSIHFIGGFDYRFKMKDKQFRFTAEAYYKALANLIPYTINNVKVVYTGENSASGHAAGIDLKLYGEFVPGTDSWIALSVMDTKMNVNGVGVPLPTDQRYGLHLFFTDYFPGTDRWKMLLRLSFADGLPFSAPHRSIEQQTFRAPAYRRADIGLSYCVYDNRKKERKGWMKDAWLGLDGLNLLGINNVNSYYWVTDVTSQQYAVPNYLTGRQVNVRLTANF